MPYGRGYGGRGMGFGFRGSSPPWPFVGLGRGGLPRCGYFSSGVSDTPVAWPYPFYATTPPTSEYAPFAPQMTREQEADFLREQAEAIKAQLEQIETRISELESKQR